MRHSITTIAIAVAVGLLATACTNASGSGGSTASSGGSTASSLPGSTVPAAVDQAAVALLPANVKAQGTLVVASDASYPPMEYFATNNKTMTGFDIDLTGAVAARLGLKIQHINAGFDSILPGLAAGKYDVGASDFTITPQRAETVDFVPYLYGGSGIDVKTGNPLGLKMQPMSLCGRTVSAESGSIQGLNQLPEISKQCVAAGKSPVSIKLFPTQTAANLALVSGRVDAIMADSVSMSIEAEASHGQFELAPGADYEPAYSGLAVTKGSPLKAALAAALKDVIASGTYKALLAKYTLPDSIAIAANKVTSP